jgi:hypothetical protein
MAIATLIQNYGYVAVFLGTLLESETVLVLAGFAAHRGYLSWQPPPPAACSATSCSSCWGGATDRHCCRLPRLATRAGGCVGCGSVTTRR